MAARKRARSPEEQQLAEIRASVAATRKARGITRRHDCGADSGTLSEDEERERADRGR